MKTESSKNHVAVAISAIGVFFIVIAFLAMAVKDLKEVNTSLVAANVQISNELNGILQMKELWEENLRQTELMIVTQELLNSPRCGICGPLGIDVNTWELTDCYGWKKYILNAGMVEGQWASDRQRDVVHLMIFQNSDFGQRLVGEYYLYEPAGCYYR